MIDNDLPDRLHKRYIDYFFKVKVIFCLALLVILTYFHYVGLFGTGSSPVILVLLIENVLFGAYFPIRLHRNEWVVAYNRIGIWTDVLAITVALHYLGGIYCMIWSVGYLLLVAVSGLFMSKRERLVFMLYVSMAFGTLCYLEVTNVLPRINIFRIPVSSRMDLFGWLSTQVLIFLVYLMSDNFMVILRRFQQLANLGHLSTELAHELRTPLQVIEGMSEVQCNPEGKREIKAQVEKVSRYIKEILALGRDEIQRCSRVRIQAVVDHAMNLVLKASGPAEGLSIEKIFGEENIWIYVDIDQTTKAISNLIRNAVDSMKRQGTLTVRIQRNGFEWVRVEVQDTGPGIEKRELKRIFEPFYTTKTGMRGVGLGLAISKKFVEANNGRIEVETLPGKGSRFIVSFPICQEHGEAQNDL